MRRSLALSDCRFVLLTEACPLDRNQIQRHADSLAFFSRDQVHSQGDMPDSSVGGMPDYAIRLDSFEETGSLVWIQAKCLDVKERVPDGRWIMEGHTFGHT